MLALLGIAAVFAAVLGGYLLEKGNPWVLLQPAELLILGVHPRWRRRGVAGALLDALGRQAGGDIFLEVAEPNGPAIALYRRHGWEQIAIRPGYYHRGSINAIVMKKGSW